MDGCGTEVGKQTKCWEGRLGGNGVSYSWELLGTAGWLSRSDFVYGRTHCLPYTGVDNEACLTGRDCRVAMQHTSMSGCP